MMVLSCYDQMTALVNTWNESAGAFQEENSHSLHSLKKSFQGVSQFFLEWSLVCYGIVQVDCGCQATIHPVYLVT